MVFVAGSALSLCASWLLVSLIERTGNRLGVTEAMLGLVAAVAADAPEITASVSALLGHQPDVGSGVVVGSNVFNLAALVGLGAVGPAASGASPGTLQARGMISELFDESAWKQVPGFEFTDITYHRAVEHGTVRIAFNRPEVRNAFRPHTVDELITALDHAHSSVDVGCVLLTGNGPSPKRRRLGLLLGRRPAHPRAPPATSTRTAPTRAGPAGSTSSTRSASSASCPRSSSASCPGWAAGGGHSLHVVCDLTIASAEHARFKQTDADVASFDGGFGSAYLARQVGQKFAREVFFLARTYSAEEAHRMGAVNAVVPHADLERVALEWARRDQRQEPDRHPHAQVRLQPHRRRTGRPAALRRRGHPPRLRLAKRRRRDATPSWRSGPRLVALPLALLGRLAA